jgi:hypothetical protein
MLDLAPNPYAEPIKKFLHDLKVTKWKFPFILQIAHAVITIFLLILLVILYVSIGIVSQISNSFWDLITGLGQKMSFSNPIESGFYALSASIYFILFLPFFIIQSPIWLSGWFSSKIGFRPFIVILLIIIVTAGLYYFQPQFANAALEKIISFQDSIRLEYFTSDSTITKDANITNIIAE